MHLDGFGSAKLKCKLALFAFTQTNAARQGTFEGLANSLTVVVCAWHAELEISPVYTVLVFMSRASTPLS